MTIGPLPMIRTEEMDESFGMERLVSNSGKDKVQRSKTGIEEPVCDQGATVTSRTSEKYSRVAWALRSSCARAVVFFFTR